MKSLPMRLGGSTVRVLDPNRVFTRSSKHRANIEQTSNKRRANVKQTCILNTFVRRLLDVCSIV